MELQRWAFVRRGRAMLAFAAAVCMVGPAVDPARAAPPDVVDRYAPLIWLHPTERFWPTDAGRFVEQSALIWSRRQGCADTRIAEAGDVDASRLGVQTSDVSERYTQHPTKPRPANGKDVCSREAAARTSDEHPRPESQRSEGFFLDIAEPARVGMPPGCPGGPQLCTKYGEAPVYYQYSAGRFITYWYFFAFSNPFRGKGIADRAGHEGDWERVSIRLNAADRATEVAYYRHRAEPSRKNGGILSWSELAAEGSVRDEHPVVFVARGTHASYPKECKRLLGIKRCLVDRRDAGSLWTASAHLRDVTLEPWYGFAGAWGQLHASDGRRSGPAGPGPNGLNCRKPAAPRAWLPEGICG